MRADRHEKNDEEKAWMGTLADLDPNSHAGGWLPDRMGPPLRGSTRKLQINSKARDGLELQTRHTHSAAGRIKVLTELKADNQK